jgi:hypothetical protein
MTTLDSLKRQPTKTLHAMVRRVRMQRRLHRHVTTADALVASVAVTIINKRKRQRG